MKNLKKLLCLILSLITVFSGLISVSAKNNITEALTPSSSEDASLKWALKLGTSYRNAPGIPEIAEDSLIVMSADTLYKLSKTDGSITGSCQMSDSPGLGYVAPYYHDGVIYCPLDNGTVEAFDFETLEKLWTFHDSIGGQSLTPILYDDGYIYTGFWNGEEEDGNYVCIDSETGSLVWEYTHKGGFYWAGCAVVGDYVIFGGDDGTVYADKPSKIFSLNKKTGEMVSSADITGDRRCTVTYDENENRVYFVTKSGYLYSFKIEDGRFTDRQEVFLGGESTSAPAVCNGRIYVGVQKSGFSQGVISVIDGVDLKIIYSVSIKGYPQNSVLVSKAYGDKVYIYTSYNSYPGGIMYFTDSENQTSAAAQELFTPEGDMSGYGISSLVSDTNGDIYYKNDSGYIFAIENVNENYLSFKNLLSELYGLIEKIVSFMEYIFQKN